jgi:protein required for attachment to host cells
MSGLKQGTWVLVADGEKALFLQNDGDEMDPDLNVGRIEEQENQPTRDQAANRRGRVFQSAGDGRSAYDDTDWHEFEKDRFAKDVAEILYKQAHKGAFDRLVIVAGPHVLGVLREEMHSEVTDKVIAEIPKTLTGHPIHEIEMMVKAEVDAAVSASRS